MKESIFQERLVNTLGVMFPGCIVMKNDPNYIQGIPDLVILYKHYWAALECKKSEDEPARPNQDFYINYMNNLSYASFIYPENKQEVLHDLQCVFSS